MTGMTKEERRYWIRHGKQDPVAAFRSHKNGAKVRGIQFLLTFEEWWGYWQEHYHLRGTYRGCMCMCRFKDGGPYAVGNVRIDTVTANLNERWEVRREKSPIPLKVARARFNECYEESGWTSRDRVFDEYRELSIWDDEEAEVL